jgi:hypothetical protein
LEPSPEAIAWGKRQASGSPRWSQTKWNKIGIIFGVELTATADQDQADEHEHQDHDETVWDAA